MNRDIFREYDIRGLADQELDSAFVRHMGRGMGQYFQAHGQTQCVVGRDGRLSSPRVQTALVAGLIASGLDVTDLGVCTTPLFYYAAQVRGFAAGAMVTASHNPPEYNGFKVLCGPSTIHGEELQALAGIVADDEAAAASETGQDRVGLAADLRDVRGVDDGEASAGRTSPLDVAPDYVAELVRRIQLGSRRLRVGVDGGNGVGGPVAQAFLAQFGGVEVHPLYCEVDGHFPHHEPDPTRSANLETLRRLVLDEHLDLGIAFDGDGDRLGVVDDQGRVIWGDTLMALFWREILDKHPGARVLVEVKCSQALVDEVTRLGGQPFFHKTGHSLIKATMRREHLLFAGEMSGHMFFADEYFGFDDALYAAGRLLRLLSHENRPLSALIDTVPHYYATAETRIPCADHDKMRVVAALATELAREHQVITVDGARAIFSDGWGLVRYSNTQPVLVARCEGKTPAALERISAAMAQAISAHPEVGRFEWAY